MNTVLRGLALVLLIILFWSLPAIGSEIHDTAMNGDVAKVKALLKNKPELVSIVDDDLGITPLHLAAEKGHKDVVELLVAKGAAVNAQNCFGDTPLFEALKGNHKDIVEFLLASKANANAKACDGLTPLHIATGQWHRDERELILTKGIDFKQWDEHLSLANNDQIYFFDTIIYASSFGAADIPDMVKMLLAKGAAVNAVTFRAFLQRCPYDNFLQLFRFAFMESSN
jgi:hypothetical protein